MRTRTRRHGFRTARHHNLPAAVATFRTEIDYIVRRLDYVEMDRLIPPQEDPIDSF